jgi:hypothetical protein
MTFEKWWETKDGVLCALDTERELREFAEEAWQAAQAAERERAQECIKELLSYVEHDSWRCGYHGECHCGLNAITERFGLPAIPLPEKGDTK